MPNDTNRPLKVFLCHIMPVGYAHPDAEAEAVRALYARLKADGVDRCGWLDKENIIAGQDWEFEIRKAVRKADGVIYV